jgi:hypothetical protein
MRPSLLLIASAASLAVACGSSTPPESPEEVLAGLPPADLTQAAPLKLLSYGDARNIYETSSSDKTPPPQSAGCPGETTSSGTITVSGNGCTGSGTTYDSGTETIATLGTTTTITWSQFTTTAQMSCGSSQSPQQSITNGTISLTTNADGTITFHVNGSIDQRGPASDTSCATAEIKYALIYDGTFAPKAGSATDGTYNGSGRFGASPYGVVDVQTKDQVIDTAGCPEGARVSGTTTLTAGANTGVIDFAGSACPSAASLTVPWTLNGKRDGTVSVLACSAGRVGHSDTSLVWLAAFAAPVLAASTRRFRAPQGRPQIRTRRAQLRLRP